MNTPRQMPDSPTKAPPDNAPARKGALRHYEEQISKLYIATNDIRSNLSYICDELPSLKTDAETRDAILHVCGDFAWETMDIQMEVRKLEDNLGLRTGEAPFHRGMDSDNPIETMGYIHDWLGPQLMAMHNLVNRLNEKAAGDANAALLSLLLTESATNIIHAALAVQDALDDIHGTLGANNH